MDRPFGWPINTALGDTVLGVTVLGQARALGNGDGGKGGAGLGDLGDVIAPDAMLGSRYLRKLEGQFYRRGLTCCWSLYRTVFGKPLLGQEVSNSTIHAGNSCREFMQGLGDERRERDGRHDPTHGQNAGCICMICLNDGVINGRRGNGVRVAWG